jgi:uncharacterized protein (DUF58 family)
MPHRKTNIPMAIDYLASVIRKRATVFIVSDFIETDFQKPLGLLNKRHDVIGVCVSDRAETKLPSIGIIEVCDAETGEIMLIDTSSASFRNKYSAAGAERFDQLGQQLRSVNIDCINISTDKPYIQDLVRFFHMRHGRL